MLRDKPLYGSRHEPISISWNVIIRRTCFIHVAQVVVCPLQTKISTWMSEEVSKRLGSVG